MTLYDSSVLIDYLDGEPNAVEFAQSSADERAVTIPLVLFEVYQGEVFKAGAAEYDAVDRALSWLSVVDETRTFARAAAELQRNLAGNGEPLSARDAYIAGAAVGLGEPLVVADDDFDVEELRNELPVTFVS